MQGPLNQRIKELLKEKRWTVNSLSKQINMSQPTLNRQITGVASIDAMLLVGLLTLFPDVSAEWLLRGVGSMTNTEKKNDSELASVCIDQAKEIYHLKQRIAELEQGEKDRA